VGNTGLWRFSNPVVCTGLGKIGLGEGRASSGTLPKAAVVKNEADNSDYYSEVNKLFRDRQRKPGRIGCFYMGIMIL
jgi:hypothetical protein